MDMSAYGGKAFIGVDDVRNGPVRGKIAAVTLSQYERPVLVFEDGSQFSLNVTNTRALIRIFGTESDAWVGHAVEMYFVTDMKDANGQENEGVRVKSVSRPKKDQQERKAPADGPSDEIPF